MSALFNFQSLLSVILLLICTCTYLRSIVPSIVDRNKVGFLGTFWKCARIGERKSPFVAIGCIFMAFSVSNASSVFSNTYKKLDNHIEDEDY